MITRKAQAPEHWTIARLLAWTEDFFRERGLSSPRLDAEILLAEALGCTRLELYTGFQKLVEPAERASFRRFVERRGRYEPVAYILGRREFYSLVFEVNPAVLVPRPETEHLVDFAVQHLRELENLDGRRILDLGTGCGNIAVAVLVNSVGVRADAVDSSPGALDVARRNSAAHGVQDRMRFFLGDLCAALPSEDEKYDVILSNPPYVSSLEYSQLMPDVRSYEPRGALVDNKSPTGDGIGYYREIFASAKPLLSSEGLIAVEMGESQALAIQETLNDSGWQATETVKDYSGVERVLVAAPRRDR